MSAPGATPPPRHAHGRLEQAHEELRRYDPLWPEQVTVLAAIVLTVALPDQLTIGPPWLLPAVEGALFAGLVATTPRALHLERAGRRHLRIGLVALMSAGNVASLILLARFGVQSHRPDGRSLLVGGIVLWITAILLFALWYWEIDRGGAVRRALHADASPDFVFPPMQDERWGGREWRPELPDYLYMSLINALTFGPPESSFPLTHVAKLVMGLQSVGAVTTATLIVARAVNQLG